jgi:hypothetical protein
VKPWEIPQRISEVTPRRRRKEKQEDEKEKKGEAGGQDKECKQNILSYCGITI